LTALAVSILLYVLLNGFDLGVEIFFVALATMRWHAMLSAVSAIWDGNESWAGVILWGAFPVVHATLFSGFLLLLMLTRLFLGGAALVPFSITIEEPAAPQPRLQVLGRGHLHLPAHAGSAP
jgi:cytochrome bd ubiquinol oxidase subunit II